MNARHRQPARLAAAAATIRARPDLGPDAFRASVAGWLDVCAAETKRMTDSGVQFPTLPSVEAILTEIERPA